MTEGAGLGRRERVNFGRWRKVGILAQLNL
jgi:hypothetical protein